MNGSAPRRRQIQVREEVIDCAAVVLFFLLIVALPAGSYFYLHRGLVARYEALADTLQQQAVEVSKLRAEVAQFASIRDTLSFSADLLRDVTAQHIYSEYVAEHPGSGPGGGGGGGKYQKRGRAASGAADGPGGGGGRCQKRGSAASGTADAELDMTVLALRRAGGGTLGEISAAAGAVASSLWAAEDWAAKKLALPLNWAHSDSSDIGSGGGSGGRGGSGKYAGHGGQRHTHEGHGRGGLGSKVVSGVGGMAGGMSGGSQSGNLRSGGGGGGGGGAVVSRQGGGSGHSDSLLAHKRGKCIPGKGHWEGDTPAVWHHYFQHLKATDAATPGYFMEVGAGDGIFTSNTYFLEVQRCWRGIVVEPTSNEYPKLEKQRPASTTVHGAVCEQDGWRKFTDVTVNGLWTGWSGFRDTFDEHHAHQVEANVRVNKGWEAKEIEVHCFRLQTLLDMEKQQHVDYLTVSAEGHELLILKSLDYSKVSVDVIEVAIHSMYDRDQIAVILESKGYDEDTAWPHTESMVFLRPAFRKSLNAMKRDSSF